jgi:diguanylate cyclase (GGDEF)-like protein/PAS domain S-box-containing protein
MLKVYDCLVNDHDLRLVVVAGLICLASTFAAFRLFARAQACAGGSRAGWLFLTSLATGLGIWSTHFVAMLAFTPPLKSSFDPELTLLSLVIAVSVTGLGFATALGSTKPVRTLLGGAMIGLGVGAMHFMGMAGFQVAGHVHWDPAYVAVSLGLGVVLAAAAIRVAISAVGPGGLTLASLILTLAICGLHFTGMAAVSIRPDPFVFVPERGASEGLIAAGIALGMLVVIGIGTVSIIIERRSRKEGEQRLHDLAEATVEGIVVCREGFIQNVNGSFAVMVGEPVEDLKGRHFRKDFLGADDAQELCPPREQTIACELSTRDGTLIPVEIIARQLGGSGDARMVYAVRDVRKRREAEQRIHFLAHHDALTGLPNRATFREALGTALAHAGGTNGTVALLYIDLDHFKEVNDLFGHPAGDAVLVEAASRMDQALGEGDLLARLGGDEFAVIQTKGPQPASAVALAERLIAAMKVDFQVAGHPLGIGLSVGAAIGPNDGDNNERLLTNADTALYRAKSEGRGRVRFYEAAMDAAVRERQSLAADLRRAIARNELVLHYQPQVRIATGEVIGFEALVRWKHPSQGLISPGVFIPIAEETGSIVALGEWVMRRACTDAAGWAKPLNVAVNLSPLQFQQTNLPEMVHGILLETGLSPARLEIEITETVIIHDMNRALSLLRRLKALGVSIAMDDFGTGYSSLSTLQAFPFDKIKIDRGFVGQIETQRQAAAIVRAVLSLGRSLGMRVVAEGIETDAQVKFLTDENCDEGQGYLYGRPQPVDGLAGLFDGTEQAAMGAKNVA